MGQGAFIGAQWTGRVMIVGASVPIACVLRGEGSPILIHGGAGSNFQEQNGLSPASLPVVFAEKCRKNNQRGGAGRATILEKSGDPAPTMLTIFRAMEIGGERNLEEIRV